MFKGILFLTLCFILKQIKINNLSQRDFRAGVSNVVALRYRTQKQLMGQLQQPVVTHSRTENVTVVPSPILLEYGREPLAAETYTLTTLSIF